MHPQRLALWPSTSQAITLPLPARTSPHPQHHPCAPSSPPHKPTLCTHNHPRALASNRGFLLPQLHIRPADTAGCTLALPPCMHALPPAQGHRRRSRRGHPARWQAAAAPQPAMPAPTTHTCQDIRHSLTGVATRGHECSQMHALRCSRVSAGGAATFFPAMGPWLLSPEPSSAVAAVLACMRPP